MSKTLLRTVAEKLGVTNYPDFRAFLAALYAEAKAGDPSYSYVKLSADLGLGSTNAHGVVHGNRPMTEKSGAKVCDALALRGVDRKYFLASIRQERAKTASEREAAFAERLALKARVLPTELDRRQLSFFVHWYNAAILELLRLPEARDDAEWIAAALRPNVAVAAVRESLALLQELGYLAPRADLGRLYPTEAQISTGNEVIGLALASYHRQMLDLAVRALDEVDANERDVSAITFTASDALFAQMKDELAALRKRMLKLSDAEEPAQPRRIHQLNLQLFPLSDTPKKESK